MYNRLIRLVGYDYPSFGWSRRLGRDRFQLEETGETNCSSLRDSSRFSQHGSMLSHLNNNLLHLHMMNTTMNRQQRKTVHTDMSSMMLSLQLNNLILRPNLKSEITCHSQRRLSPASTKGLDSPLSIEPSSAIARWPCVIPSNIS